MLECSPVKALFLVMLDQLCAMVYMTSCWSQFSSVLLVSLSGVGPLWLKFCFCSLPLMVAEL